MWIKAQLYTQIWRSTCKNLSEDVRVLHIYMVPHVLNAIRNNSEMLRLCKTYNKYVHYYRIQFQIAFTCNSLLNI